MEDKNRGIWSDIAILIKWRLTLFVVFSAAIAYLWSVQKRVDTVEIWLLSAGGFLITACANIFNQLLERHTDALMKRTRHRPLAAGRMNTDRAVRLAAITGIPGLICLLALNTISFFLGLAAVLIYVAAYTLLKKHTALAVIPGAVAGSIPVLIGCTAANGYIGTEALLLFGIQFVWQFPHTWSIAWMLDKDYRTAGIKMLPGPIRSGKPAWFIFLSSFLTIPAALLLFLYGPVSMPVALIIGTVGLVLTVLAFRLLQHRNRQSALQVMLGSILYLPLVLLALVLDKLVLL